MIESLFAWEKVQLKQRQAPLLRERERYLSALLKQGVCKARVRTIACLLLHVNRLMQLDQLRSVSCSEIQDAARRWLTDAEGHTTSETGTTSLYAFTNVAQNWFRFYNLINVPVVPVQLFEENIAQFVHHLKVDRLFSPSSVVHYKARVSSFLRWVADRCKRFSEISLSHVDEFLDALRKAGCKPRTLAAVCQCLRTFFRFCELQGWSDTTISRGIHSPRLPRYEVVPRGPQWKDIRRMIAANASGTPADLRARAIMLLCSIYATRCIEIANLTLSDFDWVNETFTLRRAKGGTVQEFPIQFEVGEAILDYLKNVRPHCSCRNLFVTLKTPYRPLNPSSLSDVVGFRIRRLGIEAESKGPHSLRHACATQLLRKGSSLREIAEFLGHRSMSSVSVYAKCDVGALKIVSSFSLAGVK